MPKPAMAEPAEVAEARDDLFSDERLDNLTPDEQAAVQEIIDKVRHYESEANRHADTATRLVQSKTELEAQLNKKSDHIAELNRNNAEQVNDLRREHALAIGQLGERARVADLRTAEVQKALDTTKGELFDALLDVERMRGYIDGIEDAEPARMVPERKQLRRGARGYVGEDGEGREVFHRIGRDVGGNWNSPAGTKRWFER